MHVAFAEDPLDQAAGQAVFCPPRKHILDQKPIAQMSSAMFLKTEQCATTSVSKLHHKMSLQHKHNASEGAYPVITRWNRLRHGISRQCTGFLNKACIQLLDVLQRLCGMMNIAVLRVQPSPEIPITINQRGRISGVAAEMARPGHVCRCS